MKKTAEIIIAERKAVEYFCRMNPLQAKKVLYAMSLLKGDQRLGDSSIPEARHIAEFYEGVINAGFAKELASLLAEEYAKVHPGVLMTKKQAEKYTDARYRKLFDAIGHYGFDYVVTALERGKAYVADPANGIDEKRMLQALRWVERNEEDQEASNYRHRKKGLQLVGLGDMNRELLPHTFVIANVYELVAPAAKKLEDLDKEDLDKQCLDEPVNQPVVPREMTVRDMKIHFIQNAHLLQDFYDAPKPVVPEGYAEDELVEGTGTYALAKRGLLKDSEAVLSYVEQKSHYDACVKQLEKIFSEEEIAVVYVHAEAVQELIKNSWQ